jgi:predicted RNase H-like HicB family nuclease
LRRLLYNVVGDSFTGALSMETQVYTAVIYQEDDGFVALCPELDVASQGDTLDEARANLREAVELFLECASPAEIAERRHSRAYTTSLEVQVG